MRTKTATEKICVGDLMQFTDKTRTYFVPVIYSIGMTVGELKHFSYEYQDFIGIVEPPKI